MAERLVGLLLRQGDLRKLVQIARNPVAIAELARDDEHLLGKLARRCVISLTQCDATEVVRRRRDCPVVSERPTARATFAQQHARLVLEAGLKSERHSTVGHGKRGSPLVAKLAEAFGGLLEA